MAITNDEVPKEIHELDPRYVVVIDQAVRLINSETTHIQALTKLVLTEVKENALAHLETCCREVGPVRPSLDICESHAEEVLVTPEKDLSSVKIDKRTNDITCCPSLPEFRMISVPFLEKVARTKTPNKQDGYE